MSRRSISSKALLIFLVYALGLFFFYLKYVPLTHSFQLALAPVLLAAFVITAVNSEWGTLFFIFAFPLVNNLPYFFGIYEHIPHAPTALVLFLFFFLGWLLRRVYAGPEARLKPAILFPLGLFALFLLVSLLITVWRYANFSPFLSDSAYELIANINGVTSGGAIMSSLFNFLNFTSGFLFFYVLLHVDFSGRIVNKIFSVLVLSTFLSLAFGLYQLFVNRSLGNLPSRVTTWTLNATFKDNLSFGAYLSVLVFLLLSLVFFQKIWLKSAAAVLFLASLLILPYSGSLSGLFSLVVAMLAFGLFLLRIALDLRKAKAGAFRKQVVHAAVLAVILGIAVSAFFISKGSVSFYKLKGRIAFLEKEKGLDLFTSSRFSYFWPMAGEMIKDYPLSGVGLGAYIIELPNYAQIHNKAQRTTDSAENFFIQVGAELGVFALFLALWIFLEIFRQARKAFEASKESEDRSYLVSGLSAGLIAVLVNFLFHTYIGSFEIIYLIWLLIGLLFALGRSGEEKSMKFHLGRGSKAWGIIVILIFASSLAWNSARSLSLKTRTELLGLKQDFGFYQQEKTGDGREFRWTRESAGTTIKIEKPLLSIPLLASHPDIKGKPVKVKIYVIRDFFKEKRLLAEVTLARSAWTTFQYLIPEDVGRKVILLLKVSRTWNPFRAAGTLDPRNLGVALGRIEFMEPERPKNYKVPSMN